MYLPIQPQPDCVSAWHEAVRAVDARPGHAGYNVIVDVAAPTANATLQNPRFSVVDELLLAHGKPVETVVNTIFPAGLYRRYGAPDFFDVFDKKVLPKVRRNGRWSGYYFERMTLYPVADGEQRNQLWDIVERIRNPKVKALNKFELSLFDPVRDVDNSPCGGQCLSFLSFKVIPGPTDRLSLTAMYRNHYYIEKLLGNLIGLGRLMAFIGRETELDVGSLTVVSTHAVIDQPGNTNRQDIIAMLARFNQAGALSAAAQSRNGSSDDLRAASSSLTP